MTKIDKVANHLYKNKTITSMEAFNEYNVTRLSAIIFELRNKYNMNIETIPVTCTDENGRKCIYARYKLGT